MSTNKAFINAYNTPVRPPIAPVLTAEPELTFNTSELVFTGVYTPPVATEETSTTSEAAEAIPTKRKPLSQVRAETMLGVRQDPPHPVASSTPQWPLACQQLLARSADKFDAVLRMLPSHSPSTLVGVVGASDGSGCSTTAICLALRSSALGFNTLLMDGNLSQAGLAKQLQVGRFTCWLDKLVTGQAIESALVRGDASGVDLLLGNTVEANELEAEPRFRASLAAGTLRRKYQRVIIDFGRANDRQAKLTADLAAALGVDFLLATASPATTEAHLSSTVASLDQQGLKLAGVIEAVA